MKLLRHIIGNPFAAAACVATIGNFDGVHLGHQRVIAQVRQQAAVLQLPSTVISFEPLPFEFFGAAARAGRIYPLRDKVALLQSLAVDSFACLRFDDALAAMSAEAFVHQLLLDSLNVRYLVVGDDFRFGHGREGDFALLRQLGAARGMQVVDTSTFLCSNQQRVSSTRIRELLGRGDLPAANALLGRAYALSGRVRHGDKLGRTIDFPTLNLRVPVNLALQKGVYAVRVYGLRDSVLPGVANLGTRPTVNGAELRLEVHLFDFSADVYGQYLQIEPVAFLRGERKFASFPALRDQIARDAEQARSLLSA